VLVSALVVTGMWRYISPPPVAERPPLSVLIANFENRTGDPVFDGVLEQALSLGVEGASFITAYPRREALRVAAAIKPGAPLDEKMTRVVALREEVAVVLAGVIEPQGTGYRISIRAVPGGDHDQELYASSVAAADKAAVLPAVGELAISVREALGDTEAPDGGAAANESFTAASLEAARAYAAAQDLQWAGRTEDAIAQYGETLRLDPEMGRAYSGLAAQYANTGRLAEAETNYQQALARIDRMTDREKFRTRGSYYLFARKPDLAFQEFTALVKAFPADTSGLTNLALASFYRREMDRALEQGRRAAAIFPKSVLQRSNVALYAMYAGRFDEAIAEAAAVHEINPTHLKAFVARALSLVALDRVPEAHATYDQLAATGPAGESFAAAGRADLALYEGRFSDAAVLLEAGVNADLARDNTAGAARKRLALAEARLGQGDLVAAAREASTAAAASEADAIRASAGIVLAASARPSQAEALAAGLEQKLETDPQAYGRIVRVELALARGDARRAVELAREAQKISDTWLGQVALGRAYLGLNAYPEAYSALEAALKRRGETTAVFLDDVPTYRYLAPVYYYMGEAQAGLKSRAAVESFKKYVAIRQHADPHAFLNEAQRRAGGP
jgi:tetratricopeptide (TPR) repeat protein